MNSVTVSNPVYLTQNLCIALFCWCTEDILSQWTASCLIRGLGRAKNNGCEHEEQWWTSLDFIQSGFAVWMADIKWKYQNQGIICVILN